MSKLSGPTKDGLGTIHIEPEPDAGRGERPGSEERTELLGRDKPPVDGRRVVPGDERALELLGPGPAGVHPAANRELGRREPRTMSSSRTVVAGTSSSS